jgi:hypothetical protein
LSVIAHFSAGNLVFATVELFHRLLSLDRLRETTKIRKQPAKNITLTIAARYGPVWSVKRAPECSDPRWDPGPPHLKL